MNYPLLFKAGVVFLAAAGNALAAERTWTGAANNDWYNAANWSPPGVPAPADALNFSGTSANISPPFTLTGTFNWTNGSLSGGLVAANGAVVHWHGGALDEFASLTVASNATLNLVGAGNKVIQGPLTNRGTVNWVDGQLDVWFGTHQGAIWNQAGGLFDIQCDRVMDDGGLSPPATLHNAGTLRKSGLTGTTTIEAIPDNTGTVLAQRGTLSFQRGGQLSGGTYEAAAGAKVHFASGAFTVNGAVDWRGPGEVRITGGTAILAWPMEFFEVHGGNVVVSAPISSLDVHGGGTVSGLGRITSVLNLFHASLASNETINATLNWHEGTLLGSGALTVASNGVLNLAGSANKFIQGPLTNQGRVNWQNGTLHVHYLSNNPFFRGAIWNQAAAVFDIQCDRVMEDGGLSPPATFRNAGTLHKSRLTGTTTLKTIMENTGTVLAQSGTLSFQRGGQLAGGTLGVWLNGPADYGRFQFSGVAMLDGNFFVTLNNGFVPAVGSSFAVVSYGSRTGAFSSLTLPGTPGWVSNYGTNAFTISLSATLAPVIVVQPADRTNAVGTLAIFSVQANGSPPPGYQWRFNGTNLADGGRISGATATTLAITGVQSADAGGYSVVVSNSAGSTNSVIAQLVVDDVPPALSGIAAVPGLTTCVVSWITDEPATRIVEYGLDASYGFTNRILSPLGTNHVVTLTGLTPDTVHHFRVRSADAVGNESASADGTFTTLPAPDLRVAEFTVTGPPMVQSGDTVDVRWIMTNAGRAAVTTSFTEFLEVRNLTTAWVQNSFPRYNGGPILPGETRTNTLAVDLFDGPYGAGQIQFTMHLDLHNEVVEFFPGINAETNNSASVTVTSTLRPYPDLTVTNLMAPSNAVPGQTVEVVWTTANEGEAAPERQWVERIYLSTDPVPGGGLLLAALDAVTNLAPAAALVRTQSVTIPLSASGNLWLLVQVDAGNAHYELDETDNLAAHPIAVITPDLRIVSLSAQAGAQFGEAFTVSCEITNAGTAAATAGWTDRIYLSAASNSLTGAILLASIPAGTNSPMPTGSSYVFSAPVTAALDGSSVPGSHFLVLSADHTGAQPESDESNNLRSIPLHLTLPPLPDLTVADIIAPPTAQPGQAFALTWAVTNQGTMPANGPWSESILYSNVVNGLQSLMLLTFSNNLPAGGSVSRTQLVTLPVSGPAGDLQFYVEVDSRLEVFEASEANNRVPAASITAVPHLLTLQLPLTQVIEDAANPILRATITRNGSRAQALTVWFTNSDPTEISSPVSAVIPAGQASVAFDLQVLPDAVVDGPQVVTITGAADGFTGVVGQITVLDSDLPALSLTLATNQVREGFTVAATLTRDLVTTEPVVVNLAGSNPSQLLAPPSVTIPANSNGVTFALLALDDTLIEPALSYTVSATASGFLSAAAAVTVLDDDVPQVIVALANHTVPESAGPQATVGTVTRTPVSDRAVNIELSSSDTTAALVPALITIPAHQASASFTVAAVNDALVDGSQTATIGGYVLASGASVRVASVTADTLTVTDDDGPALKLALGRTLVGEDLHPATTLTVTRAAPSATDLLVTLASIDTTEATVPPAVTIPGNQLSAVVNVDSVADGTNDGNHTVIISAAAPDHAPAAVVLVVSDVNLPDLFVPVVTAPATAETESYVNVSYRVANQGFANASNFTTRIFLSRDPLPGDDTLAGQFPFSGALAPGQHFEQTLQVRLPQTAGDYWIIVCTDVGETVAEALENNNCGISAAPITAVAGYGAYVQADIESGPNGMPVPLSGRATNSLGLPAPFKLVNIHVLVRGTERILSVLSDVSGNFTASFQPLPTEAGTYEIFATYPGIAAVPVQDTFTLYGMTARPASRSLRVVEQSATTGTVALENLGDVALTGLSATVASKPAALNVSVALNTNQLGGMATAELSYAVTAPGPTGSGNIEIQVTSTEGATANLRLAATVEPLRSRLVAHPPQLVAGMVQGRQTVVEFDLVNAGGLASGSVTISLPAASWMGIASTNPMPSLAPGETNRVTLVLTPPADLPLGPYTGSLAVNGVGQGVNVAFEFRCASDAKGGLSISAEDEFTYYAVGSPRLAGAEVTVRDSVTGAVVASGATDTNGLFLVPAIDEAYYRVEVTAERHTAYRGFVLVGAGTTNSLQTFLPAQTVQYRWTVEEIEVEDRYTITVTTDFETSVPVPVVVVNPTVVDLASVTAPVSQTEIEISNHGLVKVQDVQIRLPRTNHWEITPLIANLGDLPARTSAGPGTLRVPVTIRRLAPGPLDPCTLYGSVTWRLPVGPRTNIDGKTITFINANLTYCGGIDPCLGCPPDPPDPHDPDDPDDSDGGGGNPVVHEPGTNQPPGEPHLAARLGIRLDQTAILTRDAFRATLALTNRAAEPLTHVYADVFVTHLNGQSAGNLFGISAPVLRDINAVDGSGVLNTQSAASVSWTLVPSPAAAPVSNVIYHVNGTLHYLQGDVAAAITLSNVPIVVRPSPRLQVKYFHERDVFADDPFTYPIEPVVPFNLAVMVENRGGGAARNFRLISGQPRILSNEAGVPMDFNILATEVGGMSVTPSLTANFGTIASGGRAVGRWLLSAPFHGLFTNYQATFQHIDSLGRSNLSLIDEVTIHEMNRLVRAPGALDDGLPDFLVNDLPDAMDLPDHIYLSDGSTNDVGVVQTATVSATPSPTQLQVDLHAALPPGWTYLRVPEPSQGALRLVSVRRSDGAEISLHTNVWTTDRTFIGLGRRPIRENILHLLDVNSTGEYTLEYAADPPDAQAPASSVAALPLSSLPVFAVQWSGTDAGGAGIAHYDVFVSTNDGPFAPWLLFTPDTAALFSGRLGHRYAFYSIATDAAWNREDAPALSDARTTVTRANLPPIRICPLAGCWTDPGHPLFPIVVSNVVSEGSVVQFTFPAEDPDGLANELTYSLLPGAPPGVVVDPASGLVTWHTSEGDGPSTNVFVIRVTDNGIPPESTLGGIYLVVEEVNAPPDLSPIPDFTISEGRLLTITNAATDADLPSNRLTYSLTSTPAGATIGPEDGIFRWRPGPTQGPSTNVISVVVTDDGPELLTAMRTFTVIVRDTQPDFSVSIGSTNLYTGESSAVPIVLDSILDLTNLTFFIAAPMDRVTGLSLTEGSPEVTSLTLSPQGTNRSLIQFDLDASGAPGGRRSLAQLDFLAVPGRNSAIVALDASGLQATRLGGIEITNGVARGGRLIIVGDEPLLTMQANPGPELTLHGKPAVLYRLQVRSNLWETTPWVDFVSRRLADRHEVIPTGNIHAPMAFFRALEAPDGGASVTLMEANGPKMTFRIFGHPGSNYVVETATRLDETQLWSPIFESNLSNVWQNLTWTNGGESSRFFRMRQR